MQRLFLGYEGKDAVSPAWMNSSITTTPAAANNRLVPKGGGATTTSFVLKVTDDMLRQMQPPSQSPPMGAAITVSEYIEVWDYVGGASFRGFIAEKDVDGEQERSLFLFFEQGVEEAELKPGLMALFDLATECFDCQNLVICIDRQLDGLDSLVHNLGWVGLEAITLKYWGDETATEFSAGSNDHRYISDKWLFLGMEL